MILWVFVAGSFPPLFAGEDGLEFFEKRVRPVLAERCYKCHSAASEKLKGGLRLDSRQRLIQGGDTGPALDTDQPEKSLFIEAIEYHNSELQMPPKGKLDDQQIADLTAWIKLGAPWPDEAEPKDGVRTEFDLVQRRQSHWAWQPIRVVELPPIKDTSWPLQPVDHFLLEKLEAKRLKPAPPADRHTLVRRLYFDLTGLPPSPREVDQFVNDRSPKAYETLVDQLLASPHFGERWGRHWLDVVRYAETLGHEFDYAIPNAWRYRDYIIRAFNTDVPYDQFVVEQIAGDLLPAPRRHPTQGFNESIIGTGFFWLGQQTHSPVDVRLHQAETIDNQIDVLTKAFLGLTVACARCHDHKFDAISTKDFYSMYGMVASSRYAQPVIDHDTRIQPRVEQLLGLKSQIRGVLRESWSSSASKVEEYLLAADEVIHGTASQTSEDHPPLAPSRAVESVAAEHQLSVPALKGWLEAIGNAKSPDHPLFAWAQMASTDRTELPSAFTSRWKKIIKEIQPPREHSLPDGYTALGDFTQGSFGEWFVEGKAFGSSPASAGALLVAANPDQPITLLAQPAADSRILALRLQGALRSPTFTLTNRYLHLRVAGRNSRLNVVVDNFVIIRDPIYGRLKRKLNHDELRWITIDVERWMGDRVYLELNDLSVGDPSEGSYSPEAWAAVSQVCSSTEHSGPPDLAPASFDLGEREPKSLQDLAGLYQERVAATVKAWSGEGSHAVTPAEAVLLNLLLTGTTQEASSPLAKLTREFVETARAVPEPARVVGMTDGNGLDEVVFVRGNPKTPGQRVPRRFLEALGNTKPFQHGSGRLEFARQLTDPANPFTARVMVNRVWHHLFGVGIVPTPDDFGVLGTPPSHPALLDWLAHHFQTVGGWSVKELIRLLVTSRAYQMSSRPDDPKVEEVDPTNMLLHRMRVRRLEGEAIRDAILTVSGRLDRQLFGPSVPVHLTPFMEGRGRPGSSGPTDGAGRRSIYIEVRRNFLPPMMLAFDTPTPFTTIGRRTSSNVPAQALILMNDPAVVEQARLWARRVLKEGETSPRERIAKIYATAFSRAPKEEEMTEALSFLQQQRETYKAVSDADPAEEQLWTDLCHVMLNVKEFVFLN